MPALALLISRYSISENMLNQRSLSEILAIFLFEISGKTRRKKKNPPKETHWFVIYIASTKISKLPGR